MRLDYVLVRAFDQDKWWRLYSRANSTKITILKKWYTFRFMRMVAKNGGYIGPETIIKGKPDFKHDFHGVHINRNAIIGQNVSIGPNVIIGTRGGDCPKTLESNIHVF